MDIERRTFTASLENTENRSVRGYASVFGKQSEDLGGFVEIIAEGAFDGRLNDDVRALFNHDQNLILGRTASNTLRLSIDANGLGYDCDFPDTTYARDLMESVKRGDVNQSSFAFTVEEDEWLHENDSIVRVVHKVRQLYDVSPVTFPAYTDATAAVRSLQRNKEIRRQFEERRKVLNQIKSPSWA